MDSLDREYPAYHWKENKGYPTKAHREAIRECGITLSFAKHLLCCRNSWSCSSDGNFIFVSVWSTWWPDWNLLSIWRRFLSVYLLADLSHNLEWDLPLLNVARKEFRHLSVFLNLSRLFLRRYNLHYRLCFWRKPFRFFPFPLSLYHWFLFTNWYSTCLISDICPFSLSLRYHNPITGNLDGEQAFRLYISVY